MSTNENARRALHDELQQVLSQESADFLMDSIPPVPYSQIATREDVTASAAMLRGEIAEVRDDVSQLRGDVAEFRSEVSQLQSGMVAGFAKVESRFADTNNETDGRFLEVERRFIGLEGNLVEFRSDIMRDFNLFTGEVRRLFLMQIAVTIASLGIVIAMISGS